MPRGEKLLKVWNSWGSGIGYLRDDGRTPGLYYASGIIGSVNELRAAPFVNTVDISGVNATTDNIATYFFDENTSATQSYIYAVMNRVSAATGAIIKIRTDNANFATVLESTASAASRLSRPARYQDNWYLAGSDLGRKLTTIAAGVGDTWTTGAGAAGGHFTMLNHQLSQATTSSGVRILAEDAAPLTGTWGAYFGVGDKSEIPADLFGIQGMVFVLKRSGLYSFGVKNDRTVSGMILEDFGRWRGAFRNIPSTLWKSGAVIPHPAGLLYYAPGETYIPIGIETKPELGGIPPSGVTELQIGRYHGVAAVGDYLYTIYQPDPNATGALLLCGNAPGGSPSDIAWQAISSVTLKNATSTEAVHGLYGTAVGFPEGANETNPTLWFSDAAGGTTHLSYVILDSRGQPLRTRANTHRIVTSGNAWMPVLALDEPTKLARIVVYTDDMASGDEWQLSIVADDTGSDINVGAPIIGSGRHERLIQRHTTYQLVLHVKFTGTSTASRVPPSIKRIELWAAELG